MTVSRRIEPRDQRARQLAQPARARRAGRTPSEPSRKRSTSPASASSLRWREIARLRLAQDVGEVGDRELGLGEQRQHAQPGLLARRLEGAVEVGKSQMGRRRTALGRFPAVKHDIKRYLYAFKGS